MKNRNLDKYRLDVVSEVSGTGLEVGFGSGLNLPHYKNITKLYALDPSEELFKLAQENILSAPFSVAHLNAFAEQIPLPDNSLDFVVSTWSLCSIPSVEIALKEIFRVLKPDGIFSFVEHGKSPSKVIFGFQNLLTPVSQILAGGCHVNRDIEKLILNTGFEMQKIEKFSQRARPLNFMYRGVAIAKK